MTKHNLFFNIFNSYNLMIQKACEEELLFIRSSDDYQQLINKARLKWETQKINGKLPKEYFDCISSMDELSLLVKQAAAQCDEFIPVSLVETIKNREAYSIIEEYAFHEDDLVLQSLALKILGQMEQCDYTDRFISTIFTATEELIKESARQALVQSNGKAIDKILSFLSSKEEIDGDDFHLLLALVELDKGKNTDKVYHTMKNAFLKSKDKGLSARCLTDYNDTRAISFLRGILLKTSDHLDEIEKGEIRQAIRKLGGQDNDIKN